MRRLIVMASALAVSLAGCGKPTLALADDPVQRAAQCAVVATVGARVAETDVRATLPFEARVGTLHYALLAATADGGWEENRAEAVLTALPAAEPAITGGEWQGLVPACDAAYPEAKAPAALPSATLDAQLGCSLLADYVEGALRSSEAEYGDQLTPIRQMRLGLDNRIGARQARAGRTGGDEQAASRAKAMNAIVHAGAAAPVLDACVERFS